MCQRKLPCTCFHWPNLGLAEIMHDKYALHWHVLYGGYSSVLYSRFPSSTATNIHLHPDYFSLLILCLLALFYLDMRILSECMLVQNNLNYVERGLSRLCGGHIVSCPAPTRPARRGSGDIRLIPWASLKIHSLLCA